MGAYTSPEERAQVLDVTFAEQAAAEDAALLESITKAVDYEIPTNLVVGRQPYEAQEMAPIAFYPYLYVTNADNEQIMAIGNAADPWKVRATLVAGPAGAEALGDLEAPIINGFANFTSLHLSHEGEGYELEFSISYPSDLTIGPVATIPFSVGPRPLGVKFETLDDLIPNSDLLNVTFSVWDMGQDIAASTEVLGNQTWECSLAFTINVPVAIVGETSTVVPAGASNGTFEVKFEGSGLNLQFTTTCTSPESGRTVAGTSNSFIVFPGSSADTGLLRQTSIALMYSGPYSVIQGVVDAFNEELGSLECDNCPEASSRRKRSLMAGSNITRLDLDKFQFCSSPTSLRQDGSCVA